MLFEVVMAVYSANHIKPINTKYNDKDYWDSWDTLGFKGPKKNT
jgi:hypothetical protein